jgi:hypothetical protein
MTCMPVLKSKVSIRPPTTEIDSATTTAAV